MIFLDLLMPGILGTEVTKRIREYGFLFLEAPAQPVALVMASSISDKKGIDQNPKEGAEYYRLKPYRADAITKVMAAVGRDLKGEGR